MTTSPATRNCGGCAPASHHWIEGLSSVIFLNARSAPAGVPSTL